MVYEIGKNVPLAPEREDLLMIDKTFWNEARLTQLAEEVQSEKAVLTAYHNVHQLGQRRETEALSFLQKAWQPEYERRCHFVKAMPAVRDRVASILDKAGITYLFMKGAALIEGYPHGYLRQMNDLDILIKDWDELFIALKALRSNGFDHRNAIESPRMMRYISSGPFSSQMFGHLAMGKEEEHIFIDLDVRSAPYVMLATACYMESEIWQRAKGTNIPTAEDKLLIVIAHAVGHGFFLVKDLNDVYAILYHYADTFDWDYFCYYVEQSCIAYAARYALAYITTAHRADIIPEQVHKKLRQNSGAVSTLLIAQTSQASKSWRRLSETVITAVHTFNFQKAKYGIIAAIKSCTGYLNWISRLWVVQSRLLDRLLENNPAIFQLLHIKAQHFPTPKLGQFLLLQPIVNVYGDLSNEQIETYLQQVPRILQDKPPGFKTQENRLRVSAINKTTFLLSFGVVTMLLTPIDLFVITLDAVFTESEADDIVKLVESLDAMLESCNA
jgi:hypothetical protein